MHRSCYSNDTFCESQSRSNRFAQNQYTIFFINFCPDSHLLRGQTKCQTRNRKWCHRFLQNIKWIKKHQMCDTPNERDRPLVFLFSRGQFNILFIRSRWIAFFRSKKFSCNQMGWRHIVITSAFHSDYLHYLISDWSAESGFSTRLHADKATHAMHSDYKVAIASAFQAIASTGIPIESSVYLELVWVYFEFMETVRCSRKLTNGLLQYDIIDM